MAGMLIAAADDHSDRKGVKRPAPASTCVPNTCRAALRDGQNGHDNFAMSMQPAAVCEKCCMSGGRLVGRYDAQVVESPAA